MAINFQPCWEPEDKTNILGIDIGGTKTALVMGNLQAQILRRTEFLTPVADPFDLAISKIENAVDNFIFDWQKDGNNRAGIGYHNKPRAISVAVGGPLDIEKGILFSPPHLANWGTAPLKPHLQAYFNLPVFVEHDGNAGALAEYYFGAGQGTRNLIFITMGTGLGAGIILNGVIYHGSSDAAGEVGHIRMADQGPVEYGKVGSWEAFCSGSGIVKFAKMRSPDLWGPQTTTHEIVQRALAGDTSAIELIDEVGTWLGKGLALLVDILNPDMIIIGTLGVLLGELVLAPARRILKQEALAITNDACKILPAELKSSLMDVGCLMAVYDAYRNKRLWQSQSH
jgi:glucokinase